MSNFYIGQRVRIVGDWSNPQGRPSLRGMEATILERGEFGGIYCPGYPWRIQPDAHAKVVLALDSDMEPILPDGLESIEDINALYEPSPNEVLANVGMRMEWQR